MCCNANWAATTTAILMFHLALIPADVLPQEMDKLREMMLELINQPEHFKQWFGEFISQSRHELDIAPPEPPYQPDEIYDALKQGDVLVRLGGLRVLRIGDDVYTNGEKIDSPAPSGTGCTRQQHCADCGEFWRCAGRSVIPRDARGAGQ